MRCDYGARAVVDLAERYNQGPVQSSDIAGRQAIPEAYLEQLLTVLRKSGLIRSTRGPHGGHQLARPPVEITVADIVRALEGPLVAPTSRDGNGASSGIREVWQEVVAAAQRILESTTIQDLVEREQARKSRVMYYI